MQENLARRVRSLEILNDLQRLTEMGMPVEAAGDSHHAQMLDAYRHHARIGEFDHIGHFLDPEGTAVDVGANFGQYAVKLAATCAKCVVIEPIKALAWLAEALPPNCVFFNVAAGSAAGEARLTIPIDNGQQAFGLATLGDYYAGQEVVFQETPVRPLDDILQACGADERIGFIKIDVEGQETAVIQGALQTITRWRPNIQIEIWQDAVPETTLMFAELAYRGLFFFDGRLNDVSHYNPIRHNAPQNAWRYEAPLQYNPNLYVNNFFFIPT